MADTSIRVDEKTRDRFEKAAKRHKLKMKPYLDLVSRISPSKLDIELFLLKETTNHQ